MKSYCIKRRSDAVLDSAYQNAFGGFFRGKHVLVTGAAGVKGTWLCSALLELGAIVSGVDIREPDPTSNFALAGLKERIRFRKMDVTNSSDLHDIMAGQDCVFHLAALVLVHDCEARPVETYRSNTLGTATVLEALRASPRAKYGVFVTTDKVYKAKENDFWVEEDPLFASGTYAISKACAEKIIGDYSGRLEKVGKRIGIARAGNVLVGGDFYTSSQTKGAGRIAADCFEALIAGKAPVIFSPSFTRPYTYGLDVVTGYMSLMSRLDESGVQGEAFNFGPEEQSGVPNDRLATLICEKWGNNIKPLIGKLRNEPFATQALSWDKARQRLGWRPAYTLEQGVEDTVEWYRKWSEVSKGASDLRALNAKLIERHYRTAAEVGAWWASPSALDEVDNSATESGFDASAWPERLTC